MDNNNTTFPQWDFRIMFLKTIHKSALSRLGEFRVNTFKNLLGDLEEILLENIKMGLIREPTFTDCVDNAMTVKQLKDFLKSKGVRVTGKKDDLILTAIKVFSAEEKRLIEEKGSVYLLTPEGWEMVNGDNARFKNELRIFENDVVRQIVKGEIKNACKRVSDFYSSYPFPIGMGTDWSRGFHDTVLSTIYHIMNSDYLTQSMNIAQELKKHIRGIIAANYLFQFGGFSKGDIVEKILPVLPEFSCKQIEEFLDHNPTGIFAYCNSKNPAELIEVFNHVIVNYSHNQVILSEILACMGDVHHKGVEIIEGKNPFCKFCGTKILQYKWENIKSLPVLPIYPGCVCCYTYLFADN